MPYIGQPPVTGDTTSSFRLLDNIASYTLTFNGSSAEVVSTANDTLTFSNHRFVTAQRVTYTHGGGTAIGGLTSGTAYYIIKVDQNTIKLATSAANANNNSAIDLTSLGVGVSHTLNVAFDGINTKFKATYNNGTKAQLSRAGQLLLSINGVIQQPQETSAPTVGFGIDADSTIVFSVAPAVSDVVFGNIIANSIATFDISDNNVDNFTGNGSTLAFTLSKTPANNQNVLVTLDGVVQYPSDTTTTRAYSVTGSTLTFASAPANGVEIQVRHIGFAGATSSAVTGFYGRTGNAVLTSADDINVQNITGVAATFTGNVSIAGTLTYEDVTNVDSVGLITARSGIIVNTGTATTALVVNGNARVTGILTIGTSSITLDGSTDAIRIGSGVTITSSGIVATSGVTTVSAGSTAAPSITPTGDTNTGIFFPSPDTIAFAEGGVEAARIDSSGRLLVGATTAPTTGNAQYGKLVTFGNTAGAGGDARLVIGSGTVASSLSSGESLGQINFTESTGGEYAQIRAFTDGTSGTNDYPGRLVFYTTADGASSPTERLRIDSSGRVGIGTNSPSARLQVNQNTDTGTAISVVSASANTALTADFPGLFLQNTNTTNNNYNIIGFVNDQGDYSATIHGIYTSHTAGAQSGAIAFGTRNAGTYSEKLRITAAGNVGIGTTGPSSLLTLNAASNPALEIDVSNTKYADLIADTGSNATFLESFNGYPLAFSVASGGGRTERARIDTSGRLLVGTSTSRIGVKLEVEAADGTAAISATRTSSDGGAPLAYFAKIRGSSIVQSGDTLGYLSFLGYDGSSFREGASITSVVDATPGSLDMPGRLVFSTTADGASSPTERMRIAQSGQVVIYGPGGGTFLNLANSGGYSGLHEVNNTAYTIGQNSDVRAMRIGSGANWFTTGVNLAPGGTSWGTYSDERLKTDIVELDSCLESIKNIRCISYRLTNVDEPDSKKRLGVIAQDLVGKYDEAINRSRRSEDDETEYLSVQYTDLVPVLLKALQEATTKIETLEAKVAALESV